MKKEKENMVLKSVVDSTLRVESQDIEFKSNWRDEYLKAICSFANTDGGRLIIGVDNRGNFRVKTYKIHLRTSEHQVSYGTGYRRGMIE